MNCMKKKGDLSDCFSGIRGICGAEIVWGCNWTLWVGQCATEVSLAGTNGLSVAQEGSAATKAGNWFVDSIVLV
jgi:hypothetical protein